MYFCKRSEYFDNDYQIWAGGEDGDNDKRMIGDHLLSPSFQYSVLS